MTLFFLFCFFNISRASYLSKVNIKGKTKISKPIFEIELGKVIKIEKEDTIGTYNLKVKNYNENNEISQEEIIYQIELLENLEDIKATIYDLNGECKLENNKTLQYKFSKNQKEEAEYKIKVEVKNPKLINSKVKIRVNAFQKEAI